LSEYLTLPARAAFYIRAGHSFLTQSSHLRMFINAANFLRSGHLHFRRGRAPNSFVVLKEGELQSTTQRDF
jgi:hypothetical protein